MYTRCGAGAATRQDSTKQHTIPDRVAVSVEMSTAARRINALACGKPCGRKKRRQEGKPLMTKRTIALVIALAMASTAGVCTRTTNYYTNPSPIPTTPSADTIEFRVFGNPGPVPTLIKFTNSIDGATAITAISLPYVAALKSTDASIFLDVEATAVPLVAATSSLQVQIYVNGRLFREAIAVGVSPLTVSASGTWRR